MQLTYLKTTQEPDNNWLLPGRRRKTFHHMPFCSFWAYYLFCFKGRILSILRYAFFSHLIALKSRCFLELMPYLNFTGSIFFLVVPKIMAYLTIDGILDATKLTKKILITFLLWNIILDLDLQKGCRDDTVNSQTPLTQLHLMLTY